MTFSFSLYELWTIQIIVTVPCLVVIVLGCMNTVKKAGSAAEFLN